jgi:hypothetical protein
VGNDIRPVDRAQARPDNKTDAGIPRGHMRTHNPGKGIHIGNPHGLPAKRCCRLNHLGRV